MLKSAAYERRAEIGQERRARTKSVLVSAAARLLAQHGEDALTVESVAQAAGVARGTFYNYWQSRDELLGELWESVGHDPFHRIQKAHSLVEDAAERLCVTLRYCIKRAEADHAWGWLVIAFSTSPLIKNHELLSFPLPDLRRGVKDGRFDVPGLDVARDVLVGAAVNAIRTVLTTAVPSNYAEEVATLALRALGLRKAEASEVAERPLPVLTLKSIADSGRPQVLRSVKKKR